MKTLFALFLALLLPGFALAQSRELQLGSILSLTGGASPHGTAMNDGVQLAVKELREQGWKIRIDYEDDGTEPKRTISSLEHLLSKGTRLFVGPTWGLLAEPAASHFVRTKSLSLQPGNSSEFVSGGSGQFFFFLSPVRKQEPVIAGWLKANKITTVGVLIANSPWGELHRQLFHRAALVAGATVIFDESFQYGEENTAIPALATRLRANTPQVILTTSSRDISALLVTHFERQRVQVKILSPDLGDAVVEKLTAEESPSVNGFWIQAKVSDEFRKAFRAWKGREPLKYTNTAYDAVKALSVAVEAVGMDPERVKEYFEKKIDFSGAAGRIRFDKNHDIAGNEYEITEVIKLKQ